MTEKSSGSSEAKGSMSLSTPTSPVKIGQEKDFIFTGLLMPKFRTRHRKNGIKNTG